MKSMLFAQTYNDNQELVLLCKYFGVRPDLVQAAGGNISIKNDNVMMIKSSGCTLFDVDLDKNISIVNLSSLYNFSNVKSEKNFLKKIALNGKQPSIETFFHSKTKKYTAHLHPIVVIQALLEHKTELKEKFTDADFVEYYKPGITLSKKINYNKNIIFLDRHGIIFHSDNINELIDNVNTVILFCSKLVNFDMTIYNEISDIQSKYFYNYNNCPYILHTKESFNNLCQTPDCVIYTNGRASITEFDKETVCLTYNGNNYIISNNFSKCKQIEQIIQMYKSVNTKLSDNEIKELISWDFEKYRKNY